MKNVPNWLFIFQWFLVSFFQCFILIFIVFHSSNIRFIAILWFWFLGLWRLLPINKKQMHLWNVVNLLNIISSLDIWTSGSASVFCFVSISFSISFPIQNNLLILVSANVGIKCEAIFEILLLGNGNSFWICYGKRTRTTLKPNKIQISIQKWSIITDHILHCLIQI